MGFGMRNLSSVAIAVVRGKKLLYTKISFKYHGAKNHQKIAQASSQGTKYVVAENFEAKAKICADLVLDDDIKILFKSRKINHVIYS